MDNVMFSIIVPVYNAQKHLEQCVDSVLNQTYFNFELILVDDGSIDSSPSICDAYSNQDKRIKTIHQENKGQTSARKKGLEESIGKYILFLDSDDWIDQDTLKMSSSIIEKYTPDVLVFGWNEYRNGNYIEIDSYLKEGFYRRQDIEEKILASLLMNENGLFFPRALWAKVYKRELIIENLNKVPEIIRNGEDMCCVVNTILHADSLYICKNQMYMYRIENESLSKSGDEFAFKRCKVMANFLNETIIENETLKEQYNRLLVQQMYSAAVRIHNAIGFNKRFIEEYKELVSDSLCKEAINCAYFSKENRKLRMKQRILKFGMRLISSR